MILPKITYSIDEVWKQVELVQVGCRARCLSRLDVEQAIDLRKNSIRHKVIAWGGFVPTSYRGKAFSTRLILYYDSSISCERKSSCIRSYGNGETLYEASGLFGLKAKSKYPRWFPKIENDGTVIEQVSKNKLLRVMLKDRQYGTILKKILDNK